MPLYLFECEDCNMRFEGNRSIEERKHCTCPHCEGVGNQKITAVGFDTEKMGRYPGFPDAWNKWAERHEKLGSQRGRTG